MFKKFITTLGLALSLTAWAAAQQGVAQQGPYQTPNRPANRVYAPWIVSVVHTVDLDKMFARAREQENLRLGVPGSAPKYVYNVATGLVLNPQGHIITRLPNIDPYDKTQKITITTNDGNTFPAAFVGFDGATGFTILEVKRLRTALPTPTVTQSAPINGSGVYLLSADVSRTTAPAEGATEVNLTPAIKAIRGQVRTDSAYSKARGLLSVQSSQILSKNDGSIVTADDNRVIGIAQYAGYGRAYLYPISLVRDTIARRIIDAGASVPAGWLGLDGDSLALISDMELNTLGLTRMPGLLVRRVTPDSPAARVGMKPNDAILKFEGLDVAGKDQLVAAILALPTGQKVKMQVVRDQKQIEVEVALGSRPFSNLLANTATTSHGAEPTLTQEDRLRQRLTELQSQYQKYYKTPPSAQRSEALRELAIEIRQINDNLNQIAQARRERQNATAANNSYEPSRGLQTPDVNFNLGFAARDLTPQMSKYLGVKTGAWVTSIVPNTPASKSGLKVGDVITHTGDTEVINSAHLSGLVMRSNLVTLKVVRRNESLTITLNQ